MNNTIIKKYKNNKQIKYNIAKNYNENQYIRKSGNN